MNDVKKTSSNETIMVHESWLMVKTIEQKLTTPKEN